MNDNSIFQTYYQAHKLHDRYLNDQENGVTVIIPVLHTNELWEVNLHSIYKEIPVKELILSDGGCIDDTILIAQKFPRVRVLDHKSFKSLGYSIRKMIEEVQTDWFLYFHSDVYLPDGWFDKMAKHKDQYDWFGSKMRHTVMVEYDGNYGERPWAGTQMGRKNTFLEGIKKIDDDFVYRQEDFVFSDIVKQAGGKEGFVASTFHYHQTMKKESPTGRKVKSLNIELEMSNAEDIRTWDTQVKGIVKYLQPNKNWIINTAIAGTYKLFQLKAYTPSELYGWIRVENPEWLPIIKKGVFKLRLGYFLRSLIQKIKRII
jgi:glycosyltransferase involved in cell wall biosynthesis